MTSIDQMVSAQLGLITQVTGDVPTCEILGSHHMCVPLILMRGTSDEETLWEKETCYHLADTHGARVCAYRVENRRFADPLFKEEI